MDRRQKMLIQKEILKILNKGSKTVEQIYAIIKKKYPHYCDDTKKHFGTRLKWKYEVSNILQDMQKNLIWLDKYENKWKIVK